MIRTSKHYTKFSNTNKLNKLELFVNEYKRVSQIFVDYIWEKGYSWRDKDNKINTFDLSKNQLELPSMLTSNIIKESNVNTFLTGRALKCCMNQVAGMIKGETEKQRKRIHILKKLKSENVSKKKKKLLSKRLKENIPQKPNCSNVNPELNSVCCKFEERSKEFNGFIRLTSITKTKLDIKIPIKFTKHSNKLMKDSELKTSFLISKDKIDFRWEKEVKKRTKGKTVGADQGLKDVLSLSDKQVTKKIDIHGHSLESVTDRLVRRKKGSKSFKRSQDHRKNFINWSINSLNFKGVKQVNLERIWNINYKSRTSRKMSHWTNTLIRDKVESICETLGVQVIHQSSTYRSQRCSECGMVRKGNRKGKTYTCVNCGVIIDSDYNASKNHEISLPEIPYTFRNLKLNRVGFFWKESGLFDLEGRSLQSLLPIKI